MNRTYNHSRFYYRHIPVNVIPPIKLETSEVLSIQSGIVRHLDGRFGITDTSTLEYRIEDDLDRIGLTAQTTEGVDVKLQRLQEKIGRWLPDHVVTLYDA